MLCQPGPPRGYRGGTGDDCYECQRAAIQRDHAHWKKIREKSNPPSCKCIECVRTRRSLRKQQLIKERKAELEETVWFGPGMFYENLPL